MSSDEELDDPPASNEEWAVVHAGSGYRLTELEPVPPEDEDDSPYLKELYSNVARLALAKNRFLVSDDPANFADVLHVLPGIVPVKPGTADIHHRLALRVLLTGKTPIQLPIFSPNAGMRAVAAIKIEPLSTLKPAELMKLEQERAKNWKIEGLSREYAAVNVNLVKYTTSERGRPVDTYYLVAYTESTESFNEWWTKLLFSTTGSTVPTVADLSNIVYHEKVAQLNIQQAIGDAMLKMGISAVEPVILREHVMQGVLGTSEYQINVPKHLDCLVTMGSCVAMDDVFVYVCNALNTLTLKDPSTPFFPIRVGNDWNLVKVNGSSVWKRIDLFSAVPFFYSAEDSVFVDRSVDPPEVDSTRFVSFMNHIMFNRTDLKPEELTVIPLYIVT